MHRRLRFELRKRFSLFSADGPAVPAAVRDHEAPPRWPFRPNSGRLGRDTQTDVAIARANRVVGGEHHAYRAIWRRLPAMPHEWNTNLETGYRYDPTAPWFHIPHATTGSDIKDAWEPGRFTWAYDLARAWLISRQDQYAEAFWGRVESFQRGSPPYRGVQWACGQETAIRATSLLWAEAAFADAPATTPARKAILRELLWWSGRRIVDALDYAISQRNNHGISECVGLISIGARFHEVDRDAARWLAEGRKLLERQILDQFAADGWYAQHSFTYLRVALDQLVHAERVLRSRGEGIGEPALARVRSATALLGSVMNTTNGDAPNHGANDGAFVLPLTTTEFRDFRPSLTAASTTFRVPLPEGIAFDAEVLAWLDADPPALAEPGRTRVARGESGWLDARVQGTRVFARAGIYRSRPSHIDALHVDVWINGRPVAVDAGTYRYTGPWARALAEERAHNTISIDGHPMAERGPRFLWLRWPRAAIRSVHDDGESVLVEMLNESWSDAGITHRRQCRVAHDAVTILDEVILPRDASASVSMHWLLDAPPEDVMVVADADISSEIHRGDEATPYGWIADSYAVKRPACSVRITTREPLRRVRFVSGFGAARTDGYLRRVLEGGLVAAPSATFSLGGAR